MPGDVRTAEMEVDGGNAIIAESFGLGFVRYRSGSSPNLYTNDGAYAKSTLTPGRRDN